MSLGSFSYYTGCNYIFASYGLQIGAPQDNTSTTQSLNWFSHSVTPSSQDQYGVPYNTMHDKRTREKQQNDNTNIFTFCDPLSLEPFTADTRTALSSCFRSGVAKHPAPLLYVPLPPAIMYRTWYEVYGVTKALQ